MHVTLRPNGWVTTATTVGSRAHGYGARMTRPEKIGYAAAVVILVVGGAIVRTAILNWIVGPALVVVCVAVAQRLATSRSTDGNSDTSGAGAPLDGTST